MASPRVERLHIRSFGPIADAVFSLSPLHALIGPNDSGKSTVLRALRAIAQWCSATDRKDVRDLGFEAGQFDIGVSDAELHLSMSSAGLTEHVDIGGNPFYQPGLMTSGQSYVGQIPPDSPAAPLRTALNGALMLRLDPDALRKPTSLVPDGQPFRFLDERGLGLPSIYDAILSRDIPGFLRISGALSKLFPSVKALSLKNTSQGTKAVGVQLADGTFVPAELMSEGLLYYLAFAALPYLDPPALLLVEEPENGLHPARIADVVRVFREISSTTQVIVSTHSPLLINELEGHEVSVVTRTGEEGTKALLRSEPAP